jgi:hypothetical protein
VRSHRTSSVITFVCLVLLVLALANHALCAPPSSETIDLIQAEQADTISFQENVAFMSPGGEEIIPSVGTYRVEAVGQSALRLVPSNNKEVFVIKAQVTRHEDDIGSPTALRVVDDEYLIHVVLLLPKQTGLEAVGSSGRGRHRGSAELLTPVQIHDALMRKKAGRS